ncbi:MAG: diacylglycerol kinase [Betaproteobacteria bacterium HGW-Betaproteobacteria-4]|jgi:dihydrofolate reductase|nr:MAG: diacylglycerol kinase [Betaproteobacteria bacterium HGW-Betaproteobacteria-4]
MGKEQTVISAIGAVSSNGMIGLNNWLPWDIPEELAYFERAVAGAALVIGRQTYESMEVVPADSFILTRQSDFTPRFGCTAVNSIKAALRGALATGKQVFVIGGASVYAAAWPYCRYFYLTRIDRDFAGDVRFPDAVDLAPCHVDELARQTYLERHSGEAVSCRFLRYERQSPVAVTAD